MTTPEKDEWDILEIDGPPRAYFDLPVSTGTIGMPPGENAAIETIRYHTVKSPLPPAEAIERIRQALGKRFGLGIIWWRRRPHPGDEASDFRCSTSPDLLQPFWDELSPEFTAKLGLPPAK